MPSLPRRPRGRLTRLLVVLLLICPAACAGIDAGGPNWRRAGFNYLFQEIAIDADHLEYSPEGVIGVSVKTVPESAWADLYCQRRIPEKAALLARISGLDPNPEAASGEAPDCRGYQYTVTKYRLDCPARCYLKLGSVDYDGQDNALFVWSGRDAQPRNIQWGSVEEIVSDSLCH
ncbi:MAG: hypothetical protein V2A77_02675 [Pseudomonadota bacterium]